MKTLSLVLLFILAFNITFSQNKKHSTIEIYSSTIGRTIPYHSGSLYTGYGRLLLNGDNDYNIGLKYIQPINKWLNILGGIEFSNHQVKSTFVSNPDPLGGPTLVNINYDNVRFLSFPLCVQAKFLKYFFIRAGALVDVETKNNSDYLNNQSGIGLNGEIGVKYSFKNHLALFLSPFYQTHGTILFNNGKYAYKMNDTGVNFGIGYWF